MNGEQIQPPIRKTSILAILSLVCAFLCSPVGFFLGGIAWIRIRRSRGRIGGTGWALAAVAFGAFFSLCELVVFLLVMVAAVIPFFWLGPIAVNESSAKATLNLVATREEAFFRETGRYCDLVEMLGENAVDSPERKLILPGLSGPDTNGVFVKCGYAFLVLLEGKDRFVAYAWPLGRHKTGRKTFAIASGSSEVMQRDSKFEGQGNPPPLEDLATNPDWEKIPAVVHSDWDWD
jgi:hypothetical protein